MNAIITAATGYTQSDIQIFLWSVEKNCPNTTVFLIVYRRDRQSIEKIRAKYPFVCPIYINAAIRKQFSRLANYRTRPTYTWLAQQLSKSSYSSMFVPLRSIGQLAVRIVHERFFIALQVLKSHSNIFENVLLTDCRDVVIQQNPFRLVDEQLISGIEPEIIKNERYTSKWIEAAYGRDVLQRVADNPVVCAGVTLGTAAKIEDYLTALCDEMWRHLPQMIFQDFGYDQAAHIYLIFEKELELELTSNQQGIITTVSLEDAAGLEIDYRQELVKVGNRYPAVIHQYDRHPKLLNFFTELATKAPAELLS
ncbi:hypothetical protein [Chamaesiphon sp.]|uniref:hypothetical protein n=1 Tax=Chamaesiphon sp. TaxID=2814140 RepID=UPI003593BEA4